MSVAEVGQYCGEMNQASTIQHCTLHPEHPQIFLSGNLLGTIYLPVQESTIFELFSMKAKLNIPF
jgi:hypothetical protein